MKLFVLVAPLVALGLLVLLERVEAWCVRAPRASTRPRRHPDVRIRPSTRSTMPDATAPSAAVADPTVSEPVLRDPPAPPGYVDPLAGHGSLEDLVGAERPAEAPPSRSRTDSA